MNLKELSNSLGLSQSTVSRALGSYADVSPATRERVVKAAQASGYQPDANARRLATGRAEAVGIVYPFGGSGLGNPRFVEVVEGMSNGLAAANLDLLLVASRPQNELETYRRMTRARSVDALVVADTRLDDPRIAFLQAGKFPFVAYGRTQSARPYAWFDFDNVAGARLATERLIAFGHRRIALIHSPLALSFATQRRAGHLAAMAEAGIAQDPQLMLEVPLDRSSGYVAMSRLLALPNPPTAVFTDNNLAGVGALRAILEAGKTLVRDISLITYDGVPVDVPLPYRVTSVIQPTRDAGRAIAKLVIDLLAGNPVDTLQQLSMAHVEAGESDGPAPAA